MRKLAKHHQSILSSGPPPKSCCDPSPCDRRAFKSLFNGKDLSGWNGVSGRKIQIQVPCDVGRLAQRKDGPVDLQTEKTFSDFLLQGECISNGKHLNSGSSSAAYRTQYQQGYEMQIRNQWEGTDRSKPVDFWTGARSTRRQPARRVVSTDNEWFTFTLLATGNHFVTWVNGYTPSSTGPYST